MSVQGKGIAITHQDGVGPEKSAGRAQAEARLRAFDWGSTPLGPIDLWPPGLAAAVAEAVQGSDDAAVRSAMRDAAEAARMSQERFSLFMDNLPGLAWIKDGAGRYQYVNRAAEAAFGRPRAALLGKTDSEIFPPATAAQFSANDETARASGRGVQTVETLRHPDGSLHHSIVSKFPFPGPGRGDRSVGGVAIDITEQRKVEEALAESEARYRAVVEDQSDMVCRFDAEGRIVFANGAYARSVGLSAEALEGASLWDFVKEEDRPAVAELLACMTPDSPEVRIENRFNAADGVRWTLWTNRALAFGADGRWTMAQSTGVDISERKRHEEHIHLLMREVNHRAKNLLSVVQAVARQTERDSPVDFASKLGQRLRGLAASQDLLVQGDWQGVDLGDLVRSQLRHVREESDARLVLDGERITVNAAAAQGIGMALHELMTNAIKYGALSDDDGTVTVRWSRESTPDGPALAMTWTEQGGPPVEPPSRRGFGATVIERMAGMAVGGRVALVFEPSGVRWRLEAPLANVLVDGRRS